MADLTQCHDAVTELPFLSPNSVQFWGLQLCQVSFLPRTRLSFPESRFSFLLAHLTMLTHFPSTVCAPCLQERCGLVNCLLAELGGRLCAIHHCRHSSGQLHAASTVPGQCRAAVLGAAHTTDPMQALGWAAFPSQSPRY